MYFRVHNRITLSTPIKGNKIVKTLKIVLLLLNPANRKLSKKELFLKCGVPRKKIERPGNNSCVFVSLTTNNIIKYEKTTNSYSLGENCHFYLKYCCRYFLDKNKDKQFKHHFNIMLKELGMKKKEFRDDPPVITMVMLKDSFKKKDYAFLVDPRIRETVCTLGSDITVYHLLRDHHIITKDIINQVFPWVEVEYDKRRNDNFITNETIEQIINTANTSLFMLED